MLEDSSLMEPGRAYSTTVRELNEFGVLLCDMIGRLLTSESLNYHSITHRVKTEQSAIKKLAAKPQNYRQINDLKDLLGLRIITYFADEVDRIAEIVTTEFAVDQLSSVDKRTILFPDRFGYSSLHYVLTLNETR